MSERGALFQADARRKRTGWAIEGIANGWAARMQEALPTASGRRSPRAVEHTAETAGRSTGLSASQPLESATTMRRSCTRPAFGAIWDSRPPCSPSASRYDFADRKRSARIGLPRDRRYARGQGDTRAHGVRPSYFGVGLRPACAPPVSRPLRRACLSRKGEIDECTRATGRSDPR